MRATGLILAAILALAGCAEQSGLQYQGRAAQSAQECQAAYKEARARPVATDYSSSGAMIGSALGKGIANGMVDQHYQTCLERVGAAVPVIDTRTTGATKVPAATVPVAEMRRTVAPQSKSAASYSGVPQCNLKMVGGSGYVCVAGQ